MVDVALLTVEICLYHYSTSIRGVMYMLKNGPTLSVQTKRIPLFTQQELLAPN